MNLTNVNENLNFGNLSLKFVKLKNYIPSVMQDTCVGFLLGGIGEVNKHRQPNFMVVDKSKFSKVKFLFKF